jgi:RNA polymerase sigma factor (sigma-70 family)
MPSLLTMSTLAELLARHRRGDRDAAAELLRRLQQPLRALVHRQLQRRLRPQQHALLQSLSTGDLVQEVCLEVLRGLDDWDGDRDEAFLGLLATLVEHRLVDQVRRSQAGCRDVRRRADHGPVTAGVADAAGGPADAAERQESVAIYHAVLQGFSERERVLLALRIEQQAPFAELAERLGYPSPDAARKAFHAAEARLLLALRRRGLDAGGAP